MNKYDPMDFITFLNEEGDMIVEYGRFLIVDYRDRGYHMTKEEYKKLIEDTIKVLKKKLEEF